ncbi:hypothetical protein H8F21_16160 [Pseudomonas sp. P66]|uniref:Uncharacterized protein n=1 Tax=Pseudomonas arcuscaelestis TaxID=2710591 RepID=A0ABS2BZP0_9PSED|nr:hypothetical protein [Pseudomonas arcuscaelestis]MBM5459103.1 hypothetical protein [Pseudomonas arcuscaelestis]
MPSNIILLSFLGIAEHRAIVAEVMGEAFDRVDLPSKLDFNLGQILGNEYRDKLRSQAQTAPAVELVQSIQNSFPILGSLFQAGAFFRQFALPLLYLGALSERLSDVSAKPSQAERVRIEMAITVLFMDVPPYISGLIFGTCEHILKLFPDHVMKEAEMVATRGPLDPSIPLSAQMSEDGFATIVQAITAYHADLPPQAKHTMPRLLDMAEANALSLRPGPNVLSIVYDQFCDDYAVPLWKSLIETLIKHAESMELPFDHKAFSRDLIGRSIEQPRGNTNEAIKLLRGLIALSNVHLDTEAFVQRADKQLAKARELEAQITGLGANLTASAMQKIASLAQAGSAEIMANRDWFKTELDSFMPLIRGWQRFYEEWDRLLRKGPAGSNKQPAALSVVEKRPVAVAAVVGPAIDELQARVSELQDALKVKDAEASDMRSELFSLRTFKENLALPVHRPDPLAVSLDLMRRIAVRDSITPTDVLLFIEVIADGRVVVLDSAWKSAKESVAFQQTGRMLDVINTMVFPYYESLMAGNPDATAKMILGNAYSANESETVSSHRRLRGLREFEYQGKTHFFERHLKAGNGHGLEGMRIHFDIIDTKVVIAYAGPHLECSTSN